MGYAIFTESTTLNIASLGLKVGQYVEVICIGGGGGGGGGSGTCRNPQCVNRFNNCLNPHLNNMAERMKGKDGGKGGDTKFGSYVTALGGNGGKGGNAPYVSGHYNSFNGSVNALRSNGGAGGVGNCKGMNNTIFGYGGAGGYASTSTHRTEYPLVPGGGGGGGGAAGQIVSKGVILKDEVIQITVGARGTSGAGGLSYENIPAAATNSLSTDGISGGAGGAAGSCGNYCSTNRYRSGAGGSAGHGFGAGGGGGAGATPYYAAYNSYQSPLSGGGGGGAGGFQIGELRTWIHRNGGTGGSITVGTGVMQAGNGGSGGGSPDFTTMLASYTPATVGGAVNNQSSISQAAAATSGETLIKPGLAGQGLVIVMW